MTVTCVLFKSFDKKLLLVKKMNHKPKYYNNLFRLLACYSMISLFKCHAAYYCIRIIILLNKPEII